jgi:hypothetical protein
VTFLEAVKQGRPIRRQPSEPHFAGPWICIGEKQSLAGLRHPWIRLDTGDEVTLAAFDYLADDWKVMP